MNTQIQGNLKHSQITFFFCACIVINPKEVINDEFLGALLNKTKWGFVFVTRSKLTAPTDFGVSAGLPAV